MDTNIYAEVPGVKKELKYVTLRERSDLIEEAARWFHQKWGVPAEAYRSCMENYIKYKTEYGWYLCMNRNRIVGGLGIIENDFHERKDLRPNVCAVYTEENYRGQGVAGKLLSLAVTDMKSKGIAPLYLVTDHIGFYERYGWKYLCDAKETDGEKTTRIYIHE